MSIQINDRKLAQQFFNETRAWQSEMNSLVIDLMFFERILDIYGLKLMDPGEKRDLELLKETLKSFLEHRVEGAKIRLKTHEEYLQKVVEDRILLKDKDLPYKHRDMEDEFKDFRLGGGRLKNDLYNKVEQLKQF
ncbi:MAG: hypothetical protein ACPGU4_07525 [Flavobacteriales bacterium]